MDLQHGNRRATTTRRSRDAGIHIKSTCGALILPLTLAASCEFILPVAFPPNAIVFSSGYIQQRDRLRVGLVLKLTFAALLTLHSQILFQQKTIALKASNRLREFATKRIT
ncbi:MAG: hypothetical protein ACJAU9_001383 [Lentimonas sp.]